MDWFRAILLSRLWKNLPATHIISQKIAERNRLKAEEAQQAAESKTTSKATSKATSNDKPNRPNVFTELDAIKQENARLQAELAAAKRQPQQPLVEVRNLTRSINIKEGNIIEKDLEKWFVGGWEIVPGMTMLLNADGTYFERITFRRSNQQPIQPYHTISEVDKAFDAQSSRNNPILSQTPIIDMLRQGWIGDEIKDAMDNLAVDHAHAAGKQSRASRDLTHIALLTQPEVIRS